MDGDAFGSSKTWPAKVATVPDGRVVRNLLATPGTVGGVAPILRINPASALASSPWGSSWGPIGTADRQLHAERPTDPHAPSLLEDPHVVGGRAAVVPERPQPILAEPHPREERAGLGVDAADPIEGPGRLARALAQRGDEPLIVADQDGLEALKPRQDQLRDRAPVVRVIGGDDVVQHEDRDLVVQRLDRGQPQGEGQRLELAVAPMARRSNGGGARDERDEQVQPAGRLRAGGRRPGRSSR